jgi:hypothetical protein
MEPVNSSADIRETEKSHLLIKEEKPEEITK